MSAPDSETFYPQWSDEDLEAYRQVLLAALRRWPNEKRHPVCSAFADKILAYTWAFFMAALNEDLLSLQGLVEVMWAEAWRLTNEE